MIKGWRVRTRWNQHSVVSVRERKIALVNFFFWYCILELGSVCKVRNCWIIFERKKRRKSLKFEDVSDSLQFNSIHTTKYAYEQGHMLITFINSHFSISNLINSPNYTQQIDIDQNESFFLSQFFFFALALSP